ncbi:MAG: AarF/ABC1/UbiB kinase family protein [Polyangiaceae bacterium]|nr:AarF/ABC1/UbiB kinase family protein [Polyangiaceae bacterium]
MSTPARGFVRGSILGAAVARASTQSLGLALTQPFRSEAGRERAAAATDKQIARELFAACGVLRGTALKLLQVLAMEADLLPETYRAEFAAASYRAPPLNRALARRILVAELAVPECLFAAFSLTPFAAASIGQVHAATSHDGEALAVKLQYPNIADGIRGDVALLRGLLRPTRSGSVFAACFAELEARLAEELDYRCEANHTEWFRHHLRLPGVVVPRVTRALSTQRVLTTTRLGGVHLDQWLATHPSQAARDHYGQLFVDLFHHCVFELGRLHADPNPGNYLFLPGGGLGLLDFGCVRQLAPTFGEGLRRIMAPNRRPGDVAEAHRCLGVHYRRDLPQAELGSFLVRWGAWLNEPYRVERFDFGAADDYFARGSAMRSELSHCLERYDGPFLFFGRAHQGLMRTLQRLGAKVRLACDATTTRRDPIATPVV